LSMGIERVKFTAHAEEKLKAIGEFRRCEGEGTGGR
jgi:hypothetical protein